MKSCCLYFCLLVFSVCHAQKKITGRVYGPSKVAPFVKITNGTTEEVSFSNVLGDFYLRANLGDSLHFESNFYEKQSVLIDREKYNASFVVQLKERNNQLEEVIITNENSVKKFNAKEFNTDLTTMIVEDIKRNPNAYRNTANSTPILLDAVNFVGSLFKKKAKAREFINYDEFTALFTDNAFFNESLLCTTLGIPEHQHSLFFEFCEGQQIHLRYLKPENKFHLLDILVKNSQLFLKRARE